jgi:hypothetical protein
MQARPALGVEAGYRTPFARQMPGRLRWSRRKNHGMFRKSALLAGGVLAAASLRNCDGSPESAMAACKPDSVRYSIN